MKIIFSMDAWSQYVSWQEQDRRTLKRINTILRDIVRSGGFEGIGKPEPLKGDLSGFWSRRIDDTNRIVYRIKYDTCEIVQCKGHYDS